VWLLEPNKPGMSRLDRAAQIRLFMPRAPNLTTMGDDRLSLPSDFTRLEDISADGKTALINRGVGDTSVFSLSLDGTKGEPTKLVDTGETIINSSFAPDAHWILYQAVSANGNEIYVQPFPGPGLRQQIASTGAYPVWPEPR
jgi:hypothetical protein